MGPQGTGAGRLLDGRVHLRLGHDLLAVAQSANRCLQQGESAPSTDHGRPEVTAERLDQATVHPFDAPCVLGAFFVALSAVLVRRFPLEAGHVVRPHDEEGRTGFVVLPTQEEAVNGVLVRPPRTGDLGAGLVGIGAPEPRGARVDMPVDLAPGQFEAADHASFGPTFVRLGQGRVDEYEPESAGGPQRGLAQTVRATGGGAGLQALELTPDDGCELAVRVVVAGEPGGVVVVDPQQDQTALLVHVAHTRVDDPSDLLVAGGLRDCGVVGEEVVPEDRLTEGVQVFTGQLVQGVTDPDRAAVLRQTLVETVLTRLACEDLHVGVEGEGGGVAQVTAAVGVAGAVVPGDRQAGLGVGGAGVHRADVRTERVGDVRHDGRARGRPPGDPRGDGCSGEPQLLGQFGLCLPREPELPGQPRPELLTCLHAPPASSGRRRRLI